MSIAINLKTLREKKGLSQKGLGEKNGLTRNQINSYEREQARPSVEICLKLSKFFKISVEDLIK